MLVLCAYEPVRWDLKVAAGVKLQRVLLGGYHDQQLPDAPAGVPVDRYVYDDHLPPGPDRPVQYFYAFRQEPGDRDYGRTADAVRTLTGRPVATFQGAASYGGRPVVVGRQSADWVAQQLLPDVRPVYEAVAERERAAARRRFAAVRFRAVWETPAGPFDRFAMAAEFSPFGPLKPTRVPLPSRTFAAAADPTTGDVYVLGEPGPGGNGGLGRVDGATERLVAIPAAAGGPIRLPVGPQWSSGLALDTCRGRLVLPGMAQGQLVAYTLATKTWAVLAAHPNTEFAAICYAPDQDCFYAVAGTWPIQQRGVGVVRIDAATGALLTPTAITTVPAWAGRFAGGMGRGPIQLASAGGLLADVVPPPDVAHARAAAAANAGGTTVPAGPTCHLLDPATGKTLYSGLMEPQSVGVPAVPSAAEVTELWDALADSDDAKADVAAWQLAAAGDQAVEIVTQRIVPPPPAPTPAAVKALVAQLGAPEFRDREAASGRLRALGGSAADDLRRALAKTTSDEARVRIMALLKELAAQPGRAVQPSAEPTTRREWRAVRVLARVNTPAAVAALRDLASGPSGTPRWSAAALALEQLRPPAVVP